MMFLDSDLLFEPPCSHLPLFVLLQVES